MGIFVSYTEETEMQFNESQYILVMALKYFPIKIRLRVYRKGKIISPHKQKC